MDVSIDTSEVTALAADIGKAGRTVTLGAAKIILKAALNIEAGMKQDFTGHRGAPHIPRAIDHTVRGLEAEVGVNKSGPQGGLGNILAFGTSKNGAVVDHTAAMRRELPNLEKYLGDLGKNAL